jgi:acetyl-CoA carboxylase biotin carboxylase subunit
MRQALSECVIEGPKTTIPYHRQILDDERFISGEYDTSFLEAFDFKTDKYN